MKEVGEEEKGIVFNIIKYTVFILPIIIPFILIMIMTNYNILLSIFGTIAFDILLILIGFVYFYGKINNK